MQHAVGAPLPPHEQSGWTAAQGGQQPPPPALAHGGPQAPPPHPARPQGAPAQPAPQGHHPVPQGPPPGRPAPGWGGGMPQASGAQHSGPQHPAAQHPGPPHPGAPHPASAPVGPPRDTTAHVQLPPVPLPAAPHAEPGTGTATLAVLLIGPAGAGKTTVARHWAQRRRVPTAHISLDDVREWVCSGFADPQSGWNEHSEAQYRLARRTCGFAARNFLANGISCILDDAVFPDRPVVGLGGWKRHVGPGLLPVVLLPGLEIVLERNAERSGNRRLSDEEVASIHGRMAGWYGSGLPIIDNSKYDVETTARVLDEVLARSIASPPAW
ncbi:AAA family ATPase [Streptomyces sp. NPDC053755]|uniref:AAA family ATPase n=1 Tax=Streptomyces sp. NPDC053755 TaxID=3155815 RepID=UPI0034286E4C